MTQRVLKELEVIGWDRVEEINHELTVIRLRSMDVQGRNHSMTVTLSSAYPSMPPTVQTNVPAELDLEWSALSTLRYTVGAISHK